MLDLVEGRRQLVVHHRNTSLAAVSRPPYDKIAPFKARMGWTFPWFVGRKRLRPRLPRDDRRPRRPDAVQLPRRAGTRGRRYDGSYLDLTALGRQEAWDEPKGRAADLGGHAGGPGLRFHDEYDPEGGA